MDDTVLYRYYDRNGVLLYVGISNNALRRLDEHAKSKTWASEIETIKLERFSSREDCFRAETRAIKNENPIHNIVRARRLGECDDAEMIFLDFLDFLVGDTYKTPLGAVIFIDKFSKMEFLEKNPSSDIDDKLIKFYTNIYCLKGFIEKTRRRNQYLVKYEKRSPN